ncbi:MAG: DegQ family serine endoprotease [Rhizobiaceae bacterium]|nr:DegQ family serine endoprotease [Rhizobiaceae bacterium]
MVVSIKKNSILKFGTIAVLSLSLSLGAVFSPGSIAHAQGPESVADLAEGLMSAVVNISTTQKVKRRRPAAPVPRVPEGSPFQDFFDELFPNGRPGPNGKKPGSPLKPGQAPRTVQSLGSGFVIDSSGIIITNNHVINGADEITANFSDGTQLTAVLIGKDAKTDIAVLKVNPTGKLNAVSFGRSDKARIGDWVMAIGNPFGLGGSVSLGIVSAIGRDINSGPYDNFIQTDAAINRGNSGGPLFNMDGEVIGINTAIISPSGGSIGIGFSIPSKLAASVVAQLREFGETRRGWLGVQIQTVSDDIAESLGLDKASGALVSGVVRDGPAEKSGLKSGDIILEFDGKFIDTMRDLPRIVAETSIDKTVDVLVLRQGKRTTIAVTLGRLEDGEKKVAAISDDDKGDENQTPTVTIVGITVQELTDEIREADKIGSEIKGVIISKVEAGSHAEEKGIKSGEIIVQVGQEPVFAAQDVADQIKRLSGEGRKNALLMVSSKAGDIRFVVVRIEG